MTLKPRSDWLLKFRISFAIRLRATRAGFVPKDIIVTGINELKSTFHTKLSLCFSICDNSFPPPCWWLEVDIHKPAN